MGSILEADLRGIYHQGRNRARRPGGPRWRRISAILLRRLDRSDYSPDQANIAGNKSVLDQWAGLQSRNDKREEGEVIMLIHGNEAIEPGSFMQSLINTGAGGASTGRWTCMRLTMCR